MCEPLQEQFERFDEALWAAHARIADAQWQRNMLRPEVDDTHRALAEATSDLRDLILGEQAAAFVRRADGCGDRPLEEAARLLQAGREKQLVDTDPEIVRLVAEIDDELMAAVRDIQAARAKAPDAAEARRGVHRRKDAEGRTNDRRVRTLQALRNRRARDLGYESYPPLVLHRIRCSPAHVRAWLELVLEEKGTGTFSAKHPSGRPSREKEPVPFSPPSPAPRAKEAPDALWLEEQAQRGLDEAAAALRETAILDVLERFCRRAGCALRDLADELNFDNSAATGWVVIVRPTDRRLAVSSSEKGYAAMTCALHELGHAFRARQTHPRTYPHLILQPPVLDETAATVFERLAARADWLTDELGLGEDAAAAVRRADGAYRAIRLRLLAAWSLFELDTYEDPDGDLQAAYARRLHEATGVPADRAAPYHWAASGHGFFSEDPVYRYSYVLAEVLSSGILARAPEPIGPALIERIFRLYAALRPTAESLGRALEAWDAGGLPWSSGKESA